MQANLFEIIEEKEDVKEVMRDLSRTCSSCRLSTLHPENRGIIWKGSVEARIAIIGEAPGNSEQEKGIPFIGPAGQEFDRWAKIMSIDTHSDCFITNCVQCMPQRIKVDDRWSQEAPDSKEVSICFPNRALRILKAMPNLEVIVTLGWVAASAILGEKASTKGHEAQWFTSSLIPSVPILCLIHPAALLRDPSIEKTKAAENHLLSFKREYVTSKKILRIVKENLNASS